MLYQKSCVILELGMAVFMKRKIANFQKLIINSRPNPAKRHLFVVLYLQLATSYGTV